MFPNATNFQEILGNCHFATKEPFTNSRYSYKHGYDFVTFKRRDPKEIHNNAKVELKKTLLDLITKRQ